jgi:hypothetical protein
MATIPFNKPYMTGKELWYIAQAHANGQLAGLFEDAQRGEEEQVVIAAIHTYRNAGISLRTICFIGWKSRVISPDPANPFN